MDKYCELQASILSCIIDNMKNNIKRVAFLMPASVIIVASIFFFAAVTSVAASDFTRSLKIGSVGAEVKHLQEVLNTDPTTQVAVTGAGSPRNETSYFGRATKAAVIKFQIKKGITPAFGLVGPLTRAKLNSIGKDITPVANTQISTSTPTTSSSRNILDARINRANDYSIISNCLTNKTYDLCAKTDLNGDGKIDTADIAIFSQDGFRYDINKNNTVELADAPAAKSCFFKTSTASIKPMLPMDDPYQRWGGCGSTGPTLPPTVACNDATWIKASLLANACAMDAGFKDMRFGYWYGSSSSFDSSVEYRRFMSWITESSVSANTANLTELFKATFFKTSDGDYGGVEYAESDLGRLTYATIAQYDLNNDGKSDFRIATDNADMAIFDGCVGKEPSGVCAQADFNGDGKIESRDLAFRDFLARDIYGESGFMPIGWVLNWFESMLFDSTGYADIQIIKHCVGYFPFEKCGVADVDGSCSKSVEACGNDIVVSETVKACSRERCGVADIDGSCARIVEACRNAIVASEKVQACRTNAIKTCKVESADVDEFKTSASRLDFNGDGKVDLR